MTLQPDSITEDRMKPTVEVPGAVEVDHVIDPNVPESRAEWLNYMTGSKVASVLGISPFTTRLELWRQMTGRGESNYETAYATHGREREPVIRSGTEKSLGCTIAKPRMLVSNANPRHAYSPDGIIPPRDFAPARLWECKTTTAKAFAAWSHGIPTYYDAQVQWGMYVTGLSGCTVTVEAHDDFVPSVTQDYLFVRNDRLIEQLIDAVDEFLTYVDSDTPPPPLGAVVVTDPKDVDTIRRWAKDNAQRLDVEKHIKAARPLIDRLGENAQALVTEDGEVLCHWTGGESKDVAETDWSAVEADLTNSQRLKVSKRVISKSLLAETLPELVAKHTTSTTESTARSLKMGARK